MSHKSTRRVMTFFMYVAAGFGACAMVYGLFDWLGGIKINVPDLSTHDFEWWVLCLLFFILMKNDGKCECKSDKDTTASKTQG